MTARTKQILFLGLVSVITFAPVLTTIGLRRYFLDTNAIGRTTFIIQDIQIEHRTVNSLLYKVQGFGEVDSDELEKAANRLLTSCNDAAGADWYSHDASYSRLKKTIVDYCDVTRRRVGLFDEYGIETHDLVDAMKTFPTIVRTFNNDENELMIEDLERRVMAYAIRPTHEDDFEIQKELNSLRKPKYAEFKAIATEVLTYATKRANLIEELTDPLSLELLEHARDAHFQAVIVHDRYGVRAREVLTVLSLLFAIVIFFVYFNLQKTGNKLANLNSTLEDKVKARTHELQDAMSQLSGQQAYLAQKAKMSALGEMAGGIAHEINTPLAAISLTAELLAGDAGEIHPDKMVEGLNTISTIVERISKIVQGLKRFARTDEGTMFFPTPVSQIIDDTLLLCAEKLKARGVKLSINAQSGDAVVLCAPEQISQVLINLLNNSLDAVEGQSQARKWIRIETSDSNGVFQLAVADGGEPISANVREKLMQPFFTTKQIGKGTGLGLSISKGIMASHQGTLEFDASRADTTFVMTMPSLTLSDRKKKTHDLAV